jgi:hypothetical protein
MVLVRTPRGASGRWTEVIVTAVTATVAAVVLSALIRPFHVGPVGYDTAASVIYFEHIVDGQRLASSVGATPKPILTLMDGLLWTITHDWRAVSIGTIVVDALAIGLATVLAARLGGVAAGGFAAVAFLGSWDLMSDTTIAYATPVAFGALMVAGLAMTGSKPSYGVAGIGLLVAALARFEAITLAGTVAVALAVSWIRARGDPEANSWPRGALVLLAPLLAIPLMAVHDVLLAGDPTYWLKIPGQFSANYAGSAVDPGELFAFALARYAAMLPLLALATCGVVSLLRRARGEIAIGVIGLPAGVLAVLFLLAARSSDVSVRYFY